MAQSAPPPRKPIFKLPKYPFIPLLPPLSGSPRLLRLQFSGESAVNKFAQAGANCRWGRQWWVTCVLSWWWCVGFWWCTCIDNIYGIMMMSIDGDNDYLSFSSKEPLSKTERPRANSYKIKHIKQKSNIIWRRKKPQIFFGIHLPQTWSHQSLPYRGQRTHNGSKSLSSLKEKSDFIHFNWSFSFRIKLTS